MSETTPPLTPPRDSASSTAQPAEAAAAPTARPAEAAAAPVGRKAPSAAWTAFLLRAALLAVAIELVRAAVSRVVAAAGADALASGWLRLAFERAFFMTAAATLALLSFDALLRLVIVALGRWRPGRPDPGESRAEAAWLLLLAFLAPLLLTSWCFGIRHRQHDGNLPVLNGRVADLIPWLVAGLGLEVVLRVVRLWRGASPAWWLARGLLGVAWALLLLKLMTGPDLLRGDPIEWATRLQDPAISQEWLARAPRAPSRWWPVVQLASAIGLLVTLLATLRELWLAGRSWRERPRKSAAGGAQA